VATVPGAISFMPIHEDSEYVNRRKRIDPQVKSQGWQILAFDTTQPFAEYLHHAVTEFPTDNGPADYTLFVDERLLGIVEASYCPCPRSSLG
jgi:type I site-specific restriction endonuclease